MTASSLSSIKLSPEVQAFLRHWLNFHRVLWILTLVSFFIAWNRGLALLYGLFALLVALLLISYLMPRWQLRNIGVTRSFTGHFTAGQPGRITYLLASDGARYHVEILELLEFAQQREQHHFLSRISGRTSCTLQFNCVRRGCYCLQEIQLLSAYPFGIVKFHKSIETESVEVLVFPKVVELSRIPKPVVADATTWGEVLIPQQGGRDEFAAVREYRHGDELSRIHWPVSARYQNLVVKEYEKTDRPAMLVVLDGHQRFNVGQGHRSTFEYAVTIAASMIRFASREGMPCFLVSRTDHLYELTIEAYCSDFHTLYEALARLNCEGRHPYQAVVEQAHRRFPQAHLITTFRLDTDLSRPTLSPHVTQIDLEMDVNSFRSAEPPGTTTERRRESNRLIWRICANQKLENLFHET